MAIILLACIFFLSLLSAVITTGKKHELKKILTHKSFYVFLSLNLIFTAFSFSAVYADFFVLLSGITLIKSLVCVALSAVIATISTLLYYHRKIERNKKYALGLLICLVLSLFVEVFVYNFRAIQSSEYNERSLISSAEFTGGNKISSKKYMTKKDVSPIVIEITDIGEHINNIRFNAKAYNKKNEPSDITLKIEATDRANELYITSMPGRTVFVDNTLSSYIPMQLRGNSEKLKITISSKEALTVDVKDISINAPKPFSFNLSRVTLIFTLALALYVVRPSSPVYDIKLRSSKLQFVLTSLVVLAEIMLVYSIISKFNNTPDLLTINQLQYQNLAQSFRHGVLHLEIDVPKSLLEMENPYDYALRAARKQSFHWDAALFNGRYYVYFGVVPVLLLFLPYNLITNKALPNDMAIFVFAIFLIIGCFCLVRQIIKRYFPNANISYLAYILLSLLITNTSGLLHMASHPTLYPIPIIAALAFTVCGLSLWLSALSSRRARVIKLALGSLCMALVAGCRPNLLLFSFLFFPFFLGEIISAFREKRIFKKESVINAISFATPYILVAAGLMWYNNARFSSPFDFGANYNLTTNDMTSRGFVWERMGIAAFAYFFQLPKITSVFPFIRACDFDSIYMGVTIREPVYGGILSYSPFLWSGFFIPKFKETLSKYKVLIPAVMLLAFGVITALLDAQIAGILPRYFSDFSLMFYLGALFIFLAVMVDAKDEVARSNTRKILLFCIAIAFGYQTLLTLRSAPLGDYIQYLFWY